MNTLYITGNFENIQPQLVEALNKKNNINAYLFNYDMRYKKKKEMPEYGHYYCLNNRIHGPFPYIYRLYKISKEVLRYYRPKDIQVMHGNMGFRDGIICYFAWKKEKIPYIISIRDTDLNGKILWKMPYIRKLFYRVLENSKCVVCLSDSYRNVLLGRLPEDLRNNVCEKIQVIPNGINSFYIDNLYNRDHKEGKEIQRLIFVGKISKRKNLELVIESIELLREKGLFFHLDVVGAVIDKDYYKLMNSKDYITYHNKCPKEKLIDLYRKADIFVLPSHTESFGLVYAEAMSQGLPVIYTRGQGFDSEGRNAIVGYAVSDTDAQELAEKIIRICDNYDYYSNNSTQMAKQFEWGTITDRILEIYHSSIQ